MALLEGLFDIDEGNQRREELAGAEKREAILCLLSWQAGSLPAQPSQKLTLSLSSLSTSVSKR